jgi:pimeloyl-ACP methyl ester carboxylesterase
VSAVLKELSPVLVLPGMDGTGQLFRPFVERLSKRRNVEVAAYPPDLPLDYDGLTDLAASRAPRQPYVVLGESFSGPIAIEIAARDRRVTGLVLVASFARHPLPSWFEPPSRLIDVGRLPAALIEALLLGSDRTPGVRERLARILPTITPATMRARTSAVLRIDKRDRLAAVLCPILCIAATKDLLLGSRGLRDIRAVRPDSQVALIDGPHMLLETRPEAVAAAIDDFCARQVTTG